RNGYRDEGEPGVPGVRIATARGLLITTDAFGRYHIACATVPNEERGSNFILKVDERTLPAGYHATSENPRVVRLTRGKAVRANFGVAPGRDGRVSVVEAPANDVAAAEGETPVTDAATDTGSGSDEDAPDGLAVGDSEAEAEAEAEAEKAAAEADDAAKAEAVARALAQADAAAEASFMEAVALADSGIRLTFDGLKAKPALNVTAWPESAARGKPVTFRAYWNYSAWIERAELRIFHANRSTDGKPLAVIPIDDNGLAVWVPDDRAGESVRFLLRVYDANGRYDETAAMPMSVGNQRHNGEEPDPANPGLTGYGVNRLAKRSILVTGGTVTVSGDNVGDGQTVRFMGRKVPVDDEGAFAAEEIVPVGETDVSVEIRDAAGQGEVHGRRVNIPLNEWFYVAMADLTVGAREYNGPDEMEPNDGEFEDVYVDGRVAFYVKGKMKGEWLLTASMDTGEDSVEDMFGTLDEKDPRRLLRRIDPDRYYPVYGDDSTTVDDAPTSGKFYVRLERGKSHVMWGNSQAHIDGGDLARIDRSVYGAKLHYETDGVTS
ncbi:MAG: hypothetical protein KAT39_03240, partial [Alphaproteobacteria bacterium]|nr:hypothetical protein [Alphaproteobacteria bacterium]